jgi:hypothetical protein
MAANRAQFKKVNTANYSASTLQNIASKKPELSIVGNEIGKNKGSTKKVFL